MSVAVTNAVNSITMLLQVRSVPVRKDDEVSVVRGTYKVSSFKGCISIVKITLSASQPWEQQPAQQQLIVHCQQRHEWPKTPPVQQANAANIASVARSRDAADKICRDPQLEYTACMLFT